MGCEMAEPTEAGADDGEIGSGFAKSVGEAELAGDENSALQEDARIRLLEDQSPYEEQQRFR